MADDAHCTGAPTNPPYKVEMGKTTFHFKVRNAQIFSSDQLRTYDNLGLSYIRGDLGGDRVHSGSSRRIRKKPHASL